VPEPIEYRAILNLQAALQAIAVAGGYHYDVADAAVKLDPNVATEPLLNPGGTRPFMYIELKDDKWDYAYKGEFKLFQRVRVHWVHDSTPTDDASRMQTFFRGCADVEKAIAVDIGRGGLASDTRIVKRAFDLATESSRVWAEIDIEIWLLREYGAPNG
jgi:hypothetical protein